MGDVADSVIKVLSVGASGFAVVLAFMSYRLIKDPPGGHTPGDLQLYQSRLAATNRFLLLTLALFIIGLVGQYFLTAKNTKLHLVVQESQTLETFNKDFKMRPIRVIHGIVRAEIPTSRGEDRLELLLRGDDKVDISLNPLVEHIRAQEVLLRERDRQIAARTGQGGFDEGR